MAVRAVVFDIGGVLEMALTGGEPTAGFPAMITAWETRLGLAPGELDARLHAMDEQLHGQGKSGALGTCTEEEWLAELRAVTGMDQAQCDAFVRDHWDVYCGAANSELIAYFAALRPRYRTALLSNSFVGARREEQNRYHFDAITDLIVYSHEEGIAKPDPRIFQRTCDRLGVPPDETVFLDDFAGHVAAARALGMHAILFQNTAQAIADLDACLGA